MIRHSAPKELQSFLDANVTACVETFVRPGRAELIVRGLRANTGVNRIAMHIQDAVAKVLRIFAQLGLKTPFEDVTFYVMSTLNKKRRTAQDGLHYPTQSRLSLKEYDVDVIIHHDMRNQSSAGSCDTFFDQRIDRAF